jgi:mRNA interferase MazF
MTPQTISRGDWGTVAAPGDFGKPRPAVVIQPDVLTGAEVKTVTACLIGSHLVNAATFRLTVEPGAGTGLRRPSQIMVGKVISMPRTRIGRVVGRLEDESMPRLTRALAFVIGFGQ